MPPKLAGRAAARAGTPPGQEHKRSWCCPGREGSVEGSCWKRQRTETTLAPFPAHHSGRIIYDSDPMGIPLLREAANPHTLLNGSVLPRGPRGNK